MEDPRDPHVEPEYADRQSATQQNRVKCLHMRWVSVALMVKSKKVTNGALLWR